jgi:hypothetical protein
MNISPTLKVTPKTALFKSIVTLRKESNRLYQLGFLNIETKKGTTLL